MADRGVSIQIKTAADVSGAKEAEQALDKTRDAAKEAGEAVAEVPERAGMKRIGEYWGLDDLQEEAARAAEATQDLEDAAEDAAAALNPMSMPDLGPERIDEAEEAVRALEDVTEKLNEEIRTNNTLTRDQVENLQRVAGGAERIARTQRQQAAAADTAGRSTRNMGLAALEASRAYEDMQYGIHGVLNNIPQMVLSLGGTAGLTAVISIAAVAGAQLWRKFVTGPKEAAEATRDYAEELKKTQEVYAELMAQDFQNAEQRHAERMKALRGDMRSLDYSGGLAQDREAIELQRLRGESAIETAREQLRLAQLEAQMARATGEELVQLSLKREESVRRIVSLERQLTAELRAQARESARRKVSEAEERVAATRGPVAEAAQEMVRVRNQMEADERLAQESAEQRHALILLYRQEIAAMRERIQAILADANLTESGAGRDNAEIRRLSQEIRFREGRLPELLEVPEEERNAKARVANLEGELAKAMERLAGVSQEENTAVTGLTEALKNLALMMESGDLARQQDEQMYRVEDERRQFDDGERRQSEMVGQLSGLADQLGSSPELAPVVDQIRAAISDKALTTEELRQLSGALQSYERQIGTLGRTMLDTTRGMVSRIDELEREFANLKAVQGHPNP